MILRWWSWLAQFFPPAWYFLQGVTTSLGCVRRLPQSIIAVLVNDGFRFLHPHHRRRHHLAAMSPGPSFIMVARTALAASLQSGLGAALGMGLGAALFATLGLLGLHTLLNTVPTLYWGLKLAGGAYLIYLGWHIFRAARLPMAIDLAAGQGDLPLRFWVHCGLGFFTQISNPKTAVVYASIFVSLLPREINLSLGMLLVGMIFVIEGGWYAIVALALSAERSRTAYLGWKTSIDRLAGGVMAALGIKLLSERV